MAVVMKNSFFITLLLLCLHVKLCPSFLGKNRLRMFENRTLRRRARRMKRIAIKQKRV
jgi:hypothetical protein